MAGKGQEVRQQLESNGRAALALGAFGVPFMAVYEEGKDGPELFFGSDRFE